MKRKKKSDKKVNENASLRAQLKGLVATKKKKKKMVPRKIQRVRAQKLSNAERIYLLTEPASEWQKLSFQPIPSHFMRA